MPETIETESPAVIHVNRNAADACTCESRSCAAGHRGLWAVTSDDAAELRIRPGRRVDFVIWRTELIASGVVVEMVAAAQARRVISGKPCSQINDVWFRWRALAGPHAEMETVDSKALGGGA